jgi:methyl-accepting chemotaxis protein
MKTPDLSIQGRMILGFSLIAILFVAVTAVSWKQSGDMANDVDALSRSTLLAKCDSLVVDADAVRIHRAMKDVALSRTTADLDKAVARIPELEAAIASNIAAVRRSGTVDAALLDRLQAALADWATFRQDTIGLMRGGRTEEAAARTKMEGAALASRVAVAASELVAASDARAHLAVTDILRSGEHGRVVLAVTTSLAFALGAAICLALARGIKRPIVAALQVAEAVSSGHLSISTKVPTGSNELARLLQSLARMNASLVSIVSQVRDSSENISVGTGQISTGNLDLSHRTEKQAASLEETAASMQQLATAVHANAETSALVADLAAKAAASAEHGGTAIDAVVQTMKGITESSAQISEIIGVIDAIAFQTNILSLNAAVETARAGEQGRGFAVVAEEVRSLARKTGQAAKEIKSLIGSSADRVETGVRQVARAGESMAAIVSQIRRVDELVGEIRTATQEQSSGVVLIENAVAHLDQTTQQNAALVEESAAAAESLRIQATDLLSTVRMFHLEDAPA